MRELQYGKKTDQSGFIRDMTTREKFQVVYSAMELLEEGFDNAYYATLSLLDPNDEVILTAANLAKNYGWSKSKAMVEKVVKTF